MKKAAKKNYSKAKIKLSYGLLSSMGKPTYIYLGTPSLKTALWQVCPAFLLTLTQFENLKEQVLMSNLREQKKQRQTYGGFGDRAIFARLGTEFSLYIPSGSWLDRILTPLLTVLRNLNVESLKISRLERYE